MTRERCTSCGGHEFIDSIDNHGKPYRGCTWCRVAPASLKKEWLCTSCDAEVRASAGVPVACPVCGSLMIRFDPFHKVGREKTKERSK